MPEVAVLGTGQVGQTIARRAAEVGWRVTVGARSADSPSLAVFAEDAGIATGSFADAVASAPLVVNATNGAVSLQVLQSVGADVLGDRVLLDLSNELVPVEDGYPVPAASAENSLGGRLQAAFPRLRVVKALNTMNCAVMARPEMIPGDHLAFVCGDDSDAKAAVGTLLAAFGWRDSQLMDLGGIDAAAATEMMMAIWMRVTIARGSAAPRFNWALLQARS
ncbi:MAG: NAD(P)-binding domain-containing protein [Nakamurella sp.]